MVVGDIFPGSDLSRHFVLNKRCAAFVLRQSFFAAPVSCIYVLRSVLVELETIADKDKTSFLVEGVLDVFDWNCEWKK